jgi:hypothetical protein
MNRLVKLVISDATTTYLLAALLTFWAYYAVVAKLLAPLSFDEIYMAHLLWMMSQGMRPYVDFDTIHLPLFFALLQPFSSATMKDGGLDILIALKFLFALTIPLYVVLALRAVQEVDWEALGRLRAVLLTCSIALMYFALGRVTEIRPDLVALVCVNTAWFLLLRASRPSLRRRRMMLMIGASLVAVIALAFSARAGVVAIGLVAAMLYLLYAAKDRRTFIVLVVLGALIAASLFAYYVFNSDYVDLVIGSAFGTSRELTPTVPFPVRFTHPPRTMIVLTMVIAFAATVRLWRRRREALDATVLIAIATQFALIVVDPSPFEYVYGYAIVPVLVAWTRLPASLSGSGVRFSRAVAPLALATITAPLAFASIAYLVVKGHQPPVGSLLRTALDSGITPAKVAAIPTEKLVPLLYTDPPHHLFAQLAIREEICRRIRGPVLAATPSHPICVSDSSRRWHHLLWPPLMDGGGPTPPVESTAALFARSPTLVIWQIHILSNRTPPIWMRRDLSACYRFYGGFAMRAARCPVSAPTK